MCFLPEFKSNEQYARTFFCEAPICELALTDGKYNVLNIRAILSPVLAWQMCVWSFPARINYTFVLMGFESEPGQPMYDWARLKISFIARFAAKSSFHVSQLIIGNFYWNPYCCHFRYILLQQLGECGIFFIRRLHWNGFY